MIVDGNEYIVIGDYAILDQHVMLLQEVEEDHWMVLEQVFSGTVDGLPTYGMQPTKFGSVRRAGKQAFEYFRTLIETHLYKPSRSDLEMADAIHQNRWPDEETDLQPIKLHQTTFDGIVAELIDHGVIITDAQARAIVDADADLFGVLAAYYNTGGEYTGMDTQDRDMLGDGFAEVVLGLTHWPTFGEVGSEYEIKFKATVRKKAAEGTIKITEDALRMKAFS
jgi:hypothetical protein